MLTRFNNKTVTVRRLKATSFGNSYLATATVECSIQNMTDVGVNPRQGIATKSYKGYFEVDEDIQINDRLTDDDGQVYRVMDLEKIGANIGLENEYLEVVLDRPDA